MACLLENDDRFDVSIPSYESKNGVTFYKIQVTVGTISWIVCRRYKDFIELHDALVVDHCLTKEMLPQKKLIGNRDPQFIEKRSICLVKYLRTVISFLQRAMPMVVLKFLDFDKYDISSILHNLAHDFKKNEQNFIPRLSEYTFNPLQLHAISERLHKCCFRGESCDNEFNFSHILEFCYELKTVTVRGSRSNIGTSNLVYNNLTFELSVFKSTIDVYFYNVYLCNINDIGPLRRTVTSLVIYNSNIERFSDALLCDKIHKTYDENSEEHVWQKLTTIDFSWNKLKSIDRSISFSPNLRSLTLDGNQIKNLENLELLPNLTQLCICANNLSVNECLGTKLKSISHLHLSQNKITTLLPFSKLVNLKELNLASNLICDLKEIKYISHLPDLKYLVLTGNPVSTIIDYRIKVFEYFNTRAKNLCLDNERASQKELDTAAVLRALTIAREGKASVLNECVF